MSRVLVARLDNAGDVLLAGPLVRAVADPSRHVHLLCSPRGEKAAELLPGVDRIEVFDAPWIAAHPPPLTEDLVLALVRRLRAGCYDEAIIATSDHQSPLPLALVLRMAGIGRIAAISEDYPGSLLDVRHRVPDEQHEVERNLSLAAACGYRLPERDGGSSGWSCPTRCSRSRICRSGSSWSTPAPPCRRAPGARPGSARR